PEMVVKADARSPPFFNEGSSVSRSQRRFLVSSAARTRPLYRPALHLDAFRRAPLRNVSMTEAHHALRDLGRVRVLTAGSFAIISVALLAHWSTGLSATYFANDQWQHPAYTIVDRGVSTDTLTGSAPVSPDRPFSVRWLGTFRAHRA